jgi:hypothetical protein
MDSNYEHNLFWEVIYFYIIVHEHSITLATNAADFSETAVHLPYYMVSKPKHGKIFAHSELEI